MSTPADQSPTWQPEELPPGYVAPIDTAPAWVAPVIRRSIWRFVWVVLGTLVLVLMLMKARSLVSMLVIAFFFGIAMDPAVTALHTKRGWERGLPPPWCSGPCCCSSSC